MYSYDEKLAGQLDDARKLAELDPKDVMGLTLAFPDQCAKAVEIGNEAAVTAPDGITNVIVTGLGGSAVGGDFLKALMDAGGSVPVTVNRDYSLPAWVGPETLVICSSYSGNTEETLSAYADAKQKGANLLAITSGGELAERAAADGYPVVSIPGGQPPRTALGFTLMPVVALFMRWGWLKEVGSLDATVRLLAGLREEWRPEKPTSGNIAKQLAINLFDRVPILYGSGYKANVGYRWKCQLNENSKVLAYTCAYPELSHNEIVGWAAAGRQADNWATIDFVDGLESAKMETRIRVMRETTNAAIWQGEVKLRAGSLLERLMQFTYLGDFVSLYLAALNEVDPYEIESINNLKNALAKVP